MRVVHEGELVDGTVEPRDPDEEGHWEYRVRVVSEAGGFGTADGSARRLEEVLNTESRQGWELAYITTRDARYVKGETLLAVLRRWRGGDKSIERRLMQEERVRRRVLAALDAEEAAVESG